MRIIRKYTEYLKDNPEGYWFKRKVYGWGWVPATWAGWATLAVFVAYLVLITVPFANETKEGILPVGEPNMFITKVAIAVILLLWICYRKGEKPRWQWGFPRENTDQGA